MKQHPYAASAPRLPESKEIDPRTLVACEGRPIELEIGPGRGGFIFERLAVDPRICLVGLEIRLKWASIVDSKLQKMGLAGRARVFAEDARSAIARFPAACLDVVYLHFPDPWWKKRHKKRLVMGSHFADELARTLCSGGRVFLQTDVEERANECAALFADHPAFRPYAASAALAENPFSARSPREWRAMRDGLPIFRLLYARV